MLVSYAPPRVTSNHRPTFPSEDIFTLRGENFGYDGYDRASGFVDAAVRIGDVPCTGDGTMRKSPDVLTRWSARHGLRAHSLQVRVPTTAVVRHATLSHAMRPPARHPLAPTHTALHCVRTTRPAYQPVQ